jgi:hypothetical protein
MSAEREKEVVVKGKKPFFMGWAKPSQYKGFVFTEDNSTFAGPITQENIATLTATDGGDDLYAVTDDYKILKTSLVDANNNNFSAPPSDLWWDIDFPLTTNEYGIVGSETEGSFVYRGKALSSPFAEPTIGEGTVVDPLYFRDAHLAIMETNWMHFGDEHNEKQVHRLDLSFHKNSAGHLWGYVKSDEGFVKGQYKGALKEHMKVFTNIRGRRFKVKLFIATHKKHPWGLREIAVGHLIGKSF